MKISIEINFIKLFKKKGAEDEHAKTKFEKDKDSNTNIRHVLGSIKHFPIYPGTGTAGLISELASSLSYQRKNTIKMPELVEQMYCSQQIVIPPRFPYILKRFCKAAIKTQPYDLLRWSYEYFKALAEHRPPPVKLRLEYPIYSTEGGLTRGCLKVLAQQLSPMNELPLTVVKSAWQGFCLDPNELRRIFCLCEVYLRSHTVPFLHFIAVAGGLLTKSLTHTMILLCESLTKEPDGGSAAIPVTDFIIMYKFLAKMDCSKDIKYFNGYREGETPEKETTIEEEQEASVVSAPEDDASDDYWQDSEGVQRLTLINAHVGRSTRLSVKLNMPTLAKIDRSPSLERAKAMEWESIQRERKGRAAPSEDVNKRLRELSSQFSSQTLQKEEIETKKVEEKVEPRESSEEVEIFVYDESGTEIAYEIFGEPKEILYDHTTKEEIDENAIIEDERDDIKVEPPMESVKIRAISAAFIKGKEEKIQEMEAVFDEIAVLVDRYQSANYDLGMVAGRQMSSTSGEFIVQHIEKEIMAYIDEQIAVLPDPDLKKKKAKPEEVAMIRCLLDKFIDENMDIIVPEVEEVEEEEEPVPEVTQIYAVPGIGGPVDEETIKDFEEYAIDVCKVQADLFMPRNIRHFLCPPLEKYEEPDYNVNNKNEEIPTGGIMTD